MEWKVGDKTTYILRYYVPADPTYTEEVAARRCDELVEYCLENDVPAVMLYVDLSPHWYYAPDDLEHTYDYGQLIAPLAEALRKNHISYQLNYQNLFGAWDGGADLTDMNAWEYWVDEKGMTSKSTACSLGEKFRRIAGEKLAYWAATKPDAIWIDDDIRFHNHAANIRALWTGQAGPRTDYGCFCDRHIALFNEKNHLNCTRAEIEKGILEGGELRTKWLAFSGEMADDVAQWIEETIHKVSPDTRVAVMTSGPDAHSVEGRDWDSFLSKLTGAHKPLLRPHFGPYNEEGTLEFYNAYLMVEQLKANIRAQYGTAVDFCPEIENTRFTAWSKSVAGTAYQLFLSAFLGCKGVTLSLYDLEGCILKEEPEWGELLRSIRPAYDALCELNLWEYAGAGVGLLTAPDRIPESSRTASQVQGLAGGRMWDGLLIKMGIPCQYITPSEIGNAPCVLVDAYTAPQLRHEEILQLLSGGVLLDAGAAEVLIQKGYGAYLGVKVGEKGTTMANCEVYEECTRSDGTRVRVPIRIDGYKWNKLDSCGAKKLSSFTTPHGEEYIGMTRYKNSLGGIVYVFAGNGSAGIGFYTNYRAQVMKEICRDMSGGRMVEIDNAAYALTAVKKQGSTYAVLVDNMWADKMRNVTITFPENVKSAKVLTQDGQWLVPVAQGNKVTVEGCNLQLYQGIVCVADMEE